MGKEPSAKRIIGTLNERSLHAGIKLRCSEPGDVFEANVGGFVIDVLRGDLAIEVQTRSFSNAKDKLTRLCATHRVRLLYPIGVERWVVREADKGRPASRRKSPKRLDAYALFDELVSIPELVAHPHFGIELWLVREDEVRRDDGKGSRRRKGQSLVDRRLLDVIERVRLDGPSAYAQFLPPNWRGPSTNHELAVAIGRPYADAQKLTYCLLRMGLLRVAGKRAHSLLYALA